MADLPRLLGDWFDRPAPSPAVPAALVAEMTTSRPLPALMAALLPVAASRAEAPVSGFAVGAVARGLSGALYLGANLEIAGEALNGALHAEQAALLEAARAGERGVTHLASSAPPCGHCRQFLCELPMADALAILAPDGTATTLAALLPARFGPEALGIATRWMDGADLPVMLDDAAQDPLVAAALAAARTSHAPYSGAPAGIAALIDGAIVSACSVESAAFNPSVPAIVALLSALTLRGIERQRMTRLVMVEAAGRASQRGLAESVAAAALTGVALDYRAARVSAFDSSKDAVSTRTAPA